MLRVCESGALWAPANGMGALVPADVLSQAQQAAAVLDARLVERMRFRWHAGCQPAAARFHFAWKAASGGCCTDLERHWHCSLWLPLTPFCLGGGFQGARKCGWMWVVDVGGEGCQNVSLSPLSFVGKTTPATTPPCVAIGRFSFGNIYQSSKLVVCDIQRCVINAGGRGKKKRKTREKREGKKKKTTKRRQASERARENKGERASEWSGEWGLCLPCPSGSV